MRITAGSRLGRYEILASIGAGGMGEVYKARDERLHRTVALKVLRADCCGHPDYRRRFASEAEVLARLNHPRICAIYDVGTTDGVDFFVMEYLEGQSLASLVRNGGAPIRDAVRYALEIAEALAAAHRHGLVHRDLKPSNVFVTRTGAKLLDFGLARVATFAAADLSATATRAAATPSGIVLGTPAYIAPEVLRGDEADARSDLFAYGAVLFEILTGQAAFKGATAMDVVAAVLDQDAPRVGALVPGIPPMLERLVANCLEKHPQERWQSAHDAVLALRDLQYDDGAGAQVRAQPAPQRLTFQRGSIYAARFAPEGTNVLYSAAWSGMPTQVYLTRPDSPESKALGLANADLLAVSASGTLAILQDQQMYGFVRSGVLAQVHLAGAQPRTLATDIAGADWTPAPERLLVIRRNGSRCQLEWPIGRVVYESDGLISDARCSRDGQTVAFIDHPRIFDDSGAIVVIDNAGNRRHLSSGWSSIWGLAWSARGREVWFTAAKSGITRSLRAVTLSGEERLIAHTTGSLTLHDIGLNGEVLLSEDSARGDVLFRREDENIERHLTWLDGTFPRDLSDDGTMLLFDETLDGGGPAYSVYLRPTDGAPAVRLGDGFATALSPDKRWAAMIPRSTRGGISVVPTGPGEPMLVADDTLEEYRWLAWLPDGKHVVCNAAEPGRGMRLFVHRLGSAEVRAISPENISGPYAVAPNGRHVIGMNTAERSAWLIPVDAGSAPQLIPQITPDEVPIQWSEDGAALYLRRRWGEIPLRVFRLDLTTGEKRLWREFTIADRAGVQVINSIVLTRNGRNVVLAYRRVLSDLFLFAGLS